MKLREIREQKGIGLNKLAEDLEMSASYLSELERGIQKNPTKQVMEKIAIALNSTVPEIFYDELEVLK